MRRWISTLIPGRPLSINDLPLEPRNPKYRRVRNRWMQDAANVMSEAGNVLPKRLERVEASAVLWFTEHRRRDEGNFRTLLEKWLGDVLQHTGRLEDDTVEYYRFDRVTFGVSPVELGTFLVIDYDVAASSKAGH